MRQWLLGALLGISYLCVALHWLSQSLGGPESGEATVGSSLAALRRAAFLQAQRFMGRSEVVPFLKFAVSQGCALLSALHMGALLHPMRLAGVSEVLAALYMAARWVGSQRLRLLLPRCSYALAAASMLCAVILPQFRRAWCPAASSARHASVQVGCRSFDFNRERLLSAEFE